MSPRLIVSDNRDDPGNPLVLDDEAIDAVAQDPLAIGKIMVDQVWQKERTPQEEACTASATTTSTGGWSTSRRTARTS